MNSGFPSALLLVLVLLAQGCAEVQPKYHPGGPYYYRSWAHYMLPYRPVDEMTHDEARQDEATGNSYYEAFFNDDGYITVFKKHYRGKVAFQVVYHYENGMLTKSENIASEGKRKIQYFDEKGTIVRQ